MKRRYYWMQQQSKLENVIYVALWGMLFTAPLLTMFIRVKSGDADAFLWDEVLRIWQQFGGFLLLFLLHNFILAPLLVHRQRLGTYIGSTIAVVAMFALFQCATQPDDLGRRRDKMEGRHHPRELRERHEPPMEEWGDDPADHEMAEWSDRSERPAPPEHDLRHNPKHRDKQPPLMLGWHDVFSIIMLVLMFGMNLGIKYYFKSRGDQQKLVQLEKENLEQQLEYLKYQINPHFFMNTLNNIHALVDIDPEKAKDTILELSKMMRFVLYEGDKHGVPLTREFDFIRHYVTLMKLRYTDKVRISVDLPTEAPDKLIPPLMLITFIENAFKHGISYQHESFIEVKVGIEHERLRFQCRNSKADKPNQEKGGVGLANVKQRLHLLYDNNFTLNIQDEPDIYNVELTIPLT